MEANKSVLSQLLAQENGKPIQQTREELGAAIVFSGALPRKPSVFWPVVPMDAVPGTGAPFRLDIRQPLGS